jgi:hypothetical protein
MHTHRYDEYIERHEDGDIYQEENEGYQNFTISDRECLKELATCDTELLDEEACPLKKCLWKSKRLLKRQERRE